MRALKSKINRLSSDDDDDDDVSYADGSADASSTLFVCVEKQSCTHTNELKIYSRTYGHARRACTERVHDERANEICFLEYVMHIFDRFVNSLRFHRNENLYLDALR